MELRSLHYIHHLGNMRHNFAVLNLGLDGFFRSLALVDPVQHDKSAAGKHVVDSIADNELPHGVSRQRLERVKSAAGVSSCLLGFDHAHMDHKNTGSSAVSR